VANDNLKVRMSAHAPKKTFLLRRIPFFILFFFAWIFIMGTVLGFAAQEDSCSKPKVAVTLDEIINADQFYGKLNKDYEPQEKEEWLNEIQDSVMAELVKNSPDIEFVSASSGITKDCDYYFVYKLAIMGAGEDKKIGELLVSEYTAYYMRSKLAVSDRCELNPKYGLWSKITRDDRDIYYTIRRNIAAYGKIGNRIREHEKSHPVPPRGPEMEVSPDRDYVSPLKEERELKLKIDITNCRGEVVYDKNHGQVVKLPRYTERGEIKPTKGFPQEVRFSGNSVLLIIVRPVGASATYTLKKGLKPGTDRVNIETCGIDDYIFQEEEIPIKGLEIEVKPDAREICAGEESKVRIHLRKVDTEGNEEPVGGRKIDVETQGLVDGQVSPTGEVITGGNGEAVLSYHSGKKDKRVVFKAKFQPEDFSESVRDEAAVRVDPCKWDWVGTIQYDRSVSLVSSGSGDHIRRRIITHTMSLNCRLKETYSNDDKIEYDGTVQGPYTISIDYLNRGTDENGVLFENGEFTPANCTGSIDRSYNPKTKEGSGVAIELDRFSNKYVVRVSQAFRCSTIQFLQVNGRPPREHGKRRFDVIMEREGTTDRKTIKGSWQTSPCTIEMIRQLQWPVVSNGVVPGTVYPCGEKWTWNFRHLKRK